MFSFRIRHSINSHNRRLWEKSVPSDLMHSMFLAMPGSKGCWCETFNYIPVGAERASRVVLCVRFHVPSVLLVVVICHRRRVAAFELWKNLRGLWWGRFLPCFPQAHLEAMNKSFSRRQTYFDSVVTNVKICFKVRNPRNIHNFKGLYLNKPCLLKRLESICTHCWHTRTHTYTPAHSWSPLSTMQTPVCQSAQRATVTLTWCVFSRHATNRKRKRTHILSEENGWRVQRSTLCT